MQIITFRSAGLAWRNAMRCGLVRKQSFRLDFLYPFLVKQKGMYLNLYVSKIMSGRAESKPERNSFLKSTVSHFTKYSTPICRQLFSEAARWPGETRSNFALCGRRSFHLDFLITFWSSKKLCIKLLKGKNIS
jgi:hypothetical protein